MTLRNVRVKALFDTLAETVLKAKAKTPLDTIESKRYHGRETNEQFADALAEVDAELLGDRGRHAA